MVSLWSPLHGCRTATWCRKWPSFKERVGSAHSFVITRWENSIFFNNVIKTPSVLPSLFQPISIMWAGSLRNLPLFPPPPEISLLCDGDSVGQSTCASHLNPLIYHHVPLRNKGISLSATAAPEPAPANANKAKLWGMSPQQTGAKNCFLKLKVHDGLDLLKA